MDWLGIPYQEERHLQGFHLFHSLRTAKSYSVPVLVTQSSRAETQKEIQAIFDQVAERLSTGLRFLMGEEFSATDLTFSVLAAIVLMPDNYGVVLPGFGGASTFDERAGSEVARTSSWNFCPGELRGVSTSELQIVQHSDFGYERDNHC